MSIARHALLTVSSDQRTVESLRAILGAEQPGGSGARCPGRPSPMAQAKRPGLILLDAKLAGLDVKAFCQKLRDDPRTSGIPILLLAASEKEALPALEQGVNDYPHSARSSPLVTEDPHPQSPGPGALHRGPAAVLARRRGDRHRQPQTLRRVPDPRMAPQSPQSYSPRHRPHGSRPLPDLHGALRRRRRERTPEAGGQRLPGRHPAPRRPGGRLQQGRIRLHPRGDRYPGRGLGGGADAGRARDFGHSPCQVHHGPHPHHERRHRHPGSHRATWSPRTCVALAERALGEAKRAGRNRVAFSS